MWSYNQTIPSDELYHYGVLGMKWGHRKKYPDSLVPAKGSSSVTKKVINDYNKMDDKQFKKKYQVSKNRYAKRVKKYGDPYTNSPLAKFGKKQAKKQSQREINKMNSLEKDIRSFDSIKDGLKDKKGRTILSKDDVNESVNALIKRQRKNMSRASQLVKERGDNSYISYDVITGTYMIKQK